MPAVLSAFPLYHLSDPVERVCFSCCLSSESSVLMQDESRSMGDVAIDMDSQNNPMQLQLIDEQVACWCIFVKVRQMEKNIFVSFAGTKNISYCLFLKSVDAHYDSFVTISRKCIHC